MTDSATAARPATITTVVVLTWIAAAADIATGVTMLLFAASKKLSDALDKSAGQIVASGIAALLIGLVVAALAQMLHRGSRSARGLITAVMVVRIAGAIILLITVGVASLAEDVIAVVLAVVVLALLWSASANAYFARAGRP